MEKNVLPPAFDQAAPSTRNDPTQPGIPSTAYIIPTLYPFEVYAGVRLHRGVPMHLILLPGDIQVTGLDAAGEFVSSVGGDFPTYAELEHLCKCMRHRFKPSLYYTADQEPYDGDMATALFDFATRADLDAQNGARSVRVRAVRRVPANAGTSVAAITEGQIADIARKLIDQESLSDEQNATDEECLTSAGIKLGIVRMAMQIQAMLVASKHQQGGKVQ
jgi:hypothetical protein